MKYTLILGNITFHHFEPNELALFKTDKENKALIHDLGEVLFFDNKEEAYQCGDDAESYILVPDFTGEMIFENPNDLIRYNQIIFQQMRDLKTLYELLKKHYILSANYVPFICNVIEHLKNDSLITRDEALYLLGHFQSQRPSENLHVDYFIHPLYNQKPRSVWFKFGDHEEESIALRISFLDRIISELE